MTSSVQISISSIELSKSLEALVNNVKNALGGSNKVTVSVAWGFLQLAVAEVIKLIEDNNPSLKGSSKKEIALVMIGNFYDKVFPLVTVPYLPIFIQPIIQKYTKALLMLLIGTTIDSMVQIFRQNGVFVDPNSKVDPASDGVPKVSDK
jgi:hypothetical protein